MTITRPYFSFLIQVLSQFMDKPRQLHLDVIQRVLRYLKGSLGQGLYFVAHSNLHLKEYADSNWAGCSNTRKSVTGYCVFLGDALIS